MHKPILSTFNSQQHVAFLHNLYTNSEAMSYIPSYNPTITEEEILTKFETRTNRQLFVICDSITSAPIGEAGIYNYEGIEGAYELGYIICPTQWNKGYGKAVCQLLLTYAIANLAATKVVCRMYKSNVGSIKVAEACGMLLENEDILANDEVRLTYAISIPSN